MPTPDIQSLQAGDEAAWNLAFDLLWPDTFHVARRRLPGMTLADAEDVAVAAIRDAAACVGKMGSFEELRALTRWLAHRRAIDAHRAVQATLEGRMGQGGAGEASRLNRMPCGGPEPWERADAMELSRWLDEVASSLKPAERALLMGHYHDGKTHAELAATLGLARETVGVRIHRALAKVRRLLAARPGLFRELHARCRPS